MIGLYLPQSQIESLQAGNKFTTCEPKQRVEQIDVKLISQRVKSIGHTFDVADENGKIQMKAKLTDCFVTTFGKPDPKFVVGLGFGSDVQKMKSEYAKFRQNNFSGEPLTNSTELFVTIWEPLQ